MNEAKNLGNKPKLPKIAFKIPPYIPLYSLKGILRALHPPGTQLEHSNKEETAS